MKKFILIGLCFCVVTVSLAQKVEITGMVFRKGKLVILYNMFDSLEAKHYWVKVYSSKDNYQNPLGEVEGDVGPEIASGINKRALVDLKDEFGPEFKGEINFLIRARILDYHPAMELDISFQDQMYLRNYRVKEGTKLEVRWHGAITGRPLSVQLYERQRMVMDYPASINSGTYQLTIPAGIKEGFYYLKIFETQDEDQAIYTPEFRISHYYGIGEFPKM